MVSVVLCFVTALMSAGSSRIVPSDHLLDGAYIYMEGVKSESFLVEFTRGGHLFLISRLVSRFLPEQQSTSTTVRVEPRAST